jgi:hypothetical protein
MSDARPCKKQHVETAIRDAPQAPHERRCALTRQTHIAGYVAYAIAEGCNDELPRGAMRRLIVNVPCKRLPRDPTWSSASRRVSDRLAVATAVYEGPTVFILRKRGSVGR